MNKINFIPESYFKARRRRWMFARSALLLATAAGLIVAWQLMTPAHYVEALERYAETVDGQIAAETRIRDERAVTAKASRRLRDLIALRERLAPPLPTTWVVEAVASAMPPAMGLSGLSLGAVASGPADIDDDGVAHGHPFALDISVEGFAPDDVTIARFIGGLDAQPLFEGVELGFSRPVEEGILVAREFQITALIPLRRNFVRAGDEEEAAHAD